MRTEIKQDLSPELNPLDYALWTVLDNKTNIGSLKIAVEEEWNKISEEFILKPCKLFRRRVGKIIKKKC